MPDLTQKPFCERTFTSSLSTSTLTQTLPLLSPINQTDVDVDGFVAVVVAAFIYFGSFLRFMHCALGRNLLPPPFSCCFLVVFFLCCCCCCFFLCFVLFVRVLAFCLLLWPLNLIPTYLANKINLPQLTGARSKCKGQLGLNCAVV